MIEIRLNVSQERLDLLTVDEMVAVENVGAGIISIKGLRSVVAKFIVNEAGAYLAEAEALRVVGRLLRPQFFDVAREFFSAVSGLAVNPPSDGS